MKTIQTAALMALSALFAMKAEDRPKTVRVTNITPNLYANEIEPSVAFWQRLGFEKIKEVPAGNKLAFAMLRKDNLDLMYGTYSSLDQDPAAAKSYTRGTSFLFIMVDSLDPIVAATKDAELVAPVHKTFYGTTEITVKDPAGNLITFASRT